MCSSIPKLSHERPEHYSGLVVKDICREVQAETLVANVASQNVLARTGFQQYGLAPKYLKIAGTWQDPLRDAVDAEDLLHHFHGQDR